MNYLQRILLLLGLLMLFAAGAQVHAQPEDEALGYGDTVIGTFESGITEQRWSLDAESRDMIEIEVMRTSGQFTLQATLLSPDGSVIEASVSEATPQGQQLIFWDGLDTAGRYTILITGTNLTGDATYPDQYNLTLRYLGQRKADLFEGLMTPVLVEPAGIFQLEQGTPSVGEEAAKLKIAFYGGVSVTRPEPGPRPANYTLQAAPYSIADLKDNNLARLIRSISFVESGIGMITTSGASTFFTDQNIVLIHNEYSTVTIQLENGQIITTDFYRIASLWAINGYVIVNTTEGNRLVLDGSHFSILQETGQNRFAIDDSSYLVTDLKGWHTFYYLPGETRFPAILLAGSNVRFLSDTVHLSVTEAFQEATPILHIEVEREDTAPLLIDFDPLDMGDVVIENNEVTVLPLDKRELRETLTMLAALLIEKGGVRFQRTDGSYRYSLPDFTVIDTPAALNRVSEALPDSEGFFPSGANNLGNEIFVSCPCMDVFQDLIPVNPMNGNFYYSVRDFHIPSHTLILEFVRHYNSQGTFDTPEYMLTSPAGYLLGNMGIGWRHNYQIELDITYAPYGELRLILSSGSTHLFEVDPQSPEHYYAPTLPMWRIERVGGILGSWQATRTDGLQYRFDRAGRLERIQISDQEAITFTPAPQLMLAKGEAGGFFVMEPYGRRLEVYYNEQGFITRSHNIIGHETHYTHDGGGTLLTVQYPDEEQSAVYAYDNYRLVQVTDARSPYAPVMNITYNPAGQVLEWVQDPAQSRRTFTYHYETASTIRTLELGEQDSQWYWSFDAQHRITRIDSPRPEWYWELTYDTALPNHVSTYRIPEGVRLNFRYNSQGHLTEFIDPIYTNDGQASLTYTMLPDGHQLRLSEITYGGGGYERFEYNEQQRLSQHTKLVSRTTNRQPVESRVRYEYDLWGRLARVFEPGTGGTEIETVYEYDRFGYVRRITEGNGLRSTGFTHDDLGHLISFTDGRGLQTDFLWNQKQGLLQSITAPSSSTVLYEYDTFGNITALTDRGATTYYLYDGLNQITEIRNANNGLTEYSYDLAGNVVGMLLPDEDSYYQFTYDLMGDLVQAQTPGGRIYQFKHQVESNGNRLEEMTDPLGQTHRYYYDALGRLVRIEVQSSNEQSAYSYSFTYLELGRTVEISQIRPGAGRKIRVELDFEGKPLLTAVETSETSYIYNEAGNLATVTDAAGRTTTYTYDDLDRIITVTLPHDEGQLGAAYTYTYDENNNITTISDPEGYSTTYNYDDLNRLTSVVDPLGRETVYGYDERNNLVSVVDPLNNMHTARYDPMDQLLEITDPEGGVVSYIYDMLGRLTLIDYPAGLETRYTYDLDNNIIAVSYPQERTTLYGYDSLGRVTNTTDALGRTNIYTYNVQGEISQIFDALGNLESFRWSNSGRLRRYVSKLGLTYEYVLDPLGRLSQITDLNDQVLGINTRFEYDETGYIKRIIAGSGQLINGPQATIHQYTYTPEGWISSYTDPEGNSWTAEYNRNGWLTALVNPNEVRTEYVYDAAGQVIEVTYAAGTAEALTEHFVYNENGNVIQHTAVDGMVTTFTYDRNNRMTRRIIWATPPTDEQIRNPIMPELETQVRQYIYGYDELGYLALYQDAAGNITRFTHNIFGELISITRQLETIEGEPIPIVYQYEYDRVGNLISQAFPEAVNNTNVAVDYRLNMSYNAINQRVRYVDAENNVWAYTYDSSGKLTEISDPLGNITRYEFDEMGRIRSIEYPPNARVEFTYSQRAEMVIEGAETEIRTLDMTETVNYQQSTSTYVLDRVGNILSITDGSGEGTTYTYDGIGNIIGRLDPQKHTTHYVYDRHDRLTEIQSPDGIIQRRYDASGRLTEILDGAGNLLYAISYNAFGEMITLRSPGLEVVYTYETAPSSPYTIVRDAGEFGVTRYEYDSLYRLTKLTYNNEITVEYLYNRNGWIEEIRRSNGVNTSLQYDGNGHPITITTLTDTGELLEIFNYSYDSAGNITSISRDDRWRVLVSYDSAGRIITERWLDPNNQTHYLMSIRYDDAGNPVERFITRRSEPYPTRTLYLYNNRNQLISEIRGYVPREEINSSFSLAALFLLIQVGGGALWWRTRRSLTRLLLLEASLLSFFLPLSATAQQSLPESEYRIDYAYDSAGNLASIQYPSENGGQLTFDYDSENRLIRVSGISEQGKEVDTHYTYDALNHLVDWRSLDQSYRFYYDQYSLIGIRNLQTGELMRYFESADHSPLLMVNADGSQEWFLTDAIRSVRQILNAQGLPIMGAESGYDYNTFGDLIAPYGETFVLPQKAMPVPQFAGQPTDPVVGYVLMGLRAYDPALGRFIQRDPLRHDPRGTLYTYAYNQPTTYIDPEGTTPVEVLEATRISILPQILHPELTASPLLPPAFYPPSTHRAQQQEHYRALNIAAALYFEWNETGMLVSPFLNDFYTYQMHPVTMPALQAWGHPFQQMLATYHPGSGWSNLPAPSPAAATSYLELLGPAESLLMQSYTLGRSWCEPGLSQYLHLPVPNIPPVPSLDTFYHFEMQQMSEISLVGMVAPEAQQLMIQPLKALQITPTVPEIEPLSVPLNPASLAEINNLRKQQREFYYTTLNIAPFDPFIDSTFNSGTR